ncbi:MAG: glycosyl transferase [Bacteroidetes bacterium GWA2_30_7]|nr:MAG: glycosyl transferase [Bacteroidetes bacterium GWA2_30_7]
MEIKLSVVIITLNEEKNLERCFISVQDIADEIVVLDSFSTDKTEEICKKYDVKFFQHKFDGHIEQKNRALTYSSNNYVLSMDADEALSPMLIESIKQIKKDCQHDGYYFNRLNNYCGKWIRHTSWSPDRKLRIWDITKGKWGGENPHDKFILNENCSKQYLKGELLHYSFNSLEEHVIQINKFSTIAAKAKYVKGKRAGFIDYIIAPIWEFKRSYFIKLGFLDGYYGFVVSIMTSYSVFLKYIKLKKLWEKE